MEITSSSGCGDITSARPLPLASPSAAFGMPAPLLAAAAAAVLPAASMRACTPATPVTAQDLQAKTCICHTWGSSTSIQEADFIPFEAADECVHAQLNGRRIALPTTSRGVWAELNMTHPDFSAAMLFSQRLDIALKTAVKLATARVLVSETCQVRHGGNIPAGMCRASL